MPNTEQGVSLQTDQLQPVAGGPIRTVSVVTPIGGVPTQVQMQVVAIADESGVILDFEQQKSLDKEMLACLRDIRALLATWMGNYVMDVRDDDMTLQGSIMS